MSEEDKQEEVSPNGNRWTASTSEGPMVAPETAPEEDLAEKVAVQAKELAALHDRYLRLAAEFDNYRKRVVRDRAEVVRTARESLLIEFLPVLDNLERALAAARSSAASSRANDALIEGVEITLRLFKGVLEKEGVRAIESIGREFDPTVHHAVEQVQTTHHPENTVVEEILRGYLLDQKVLRPALVKVATRGAAPSEGEGPSQVTGSE